MFPFAKLRDAITEPVVGEIVRVPSEFETEFTAPPDPPTQVPLTAKHPEERLIPFAKVELAVDEVTLRAVVCTPAAKVEVAVVDVDTR